MEEINKNLEEYIEKNVLPQYDTNNVGGHGKEQQLFIEVLKL